MKRWTILSTLAIGASLLGGCASTGPSPELVDARRTYHQAVASPAQHYVPAHVLAARQALDRAEVAHADDAGSFEERSLAYIAERKAQLAMTYGSYAQAQRERALSEQAYNRAQVRMRERARAEAQRAQAALAQTRQDLGEVRRALAAQDDRVSEQAQQLMAREKELAAREAELAASSGALEKEREARKNAEMTAAAALKSLQDVAMVKEEARGTVITLNGEVLFASGRSELLHTARERLAQVAQALKEIGDDKVILVEGHTDSRGSDALNMALSERRAAAVRDYLVAEGVDASRIRAEGRGEHEPIADNSSAEGRANNRRVEIIIQDRDRASR
jgi:outer membrane protein OmpA-like peptidoglycan-associated protein